MPEADLTATVVATLDAAEELVRSGDADAALVPSDGGTPSSVTTGSTPSWPAG